MKIGRIGGAGGVVPRQGLEFMEQFRKKEALFMLRMAIWGLKLS
jgi:hypothetical protein